MVHTSLMPALAAFFAGPATQRNLPASRIKRQTLGLRFVRKDEPLKGILAELREAGCHD